MEYTFLEKQLSFTIKEKKKNVIALSCRASSRRTKKRVIKKVRIITSASPFDTHYAYYANREKKKHRAGSGDADNVGIDSTALCVCSLQFITMMNIVCTRAPPAHILRERERERGSRDTPARQLCTRASFRMHTCTRANRNSGLWPRTTCSAYYECMRLERPHTSAYERR